MFCERDVLRNFAKFTGKHLCRSLFCARVSVPESQSLRPATLLKKRLWYRCFPVNFAKFLRKSFFIEHLRWLLLNLLSRLWLKTSINFMYSELVDNPFFSISISEIAQKPYMELGKEKQNRATTIISWKLKKRCKQTYNENIKNQTKKKTLTRTVTSVATANYNVFLQLRCLFSKYCLWGKKSFLLMTSHTKWFLRQTWSILHCTKMKKSIMENFIFCAVLDLSRWPKAEILESNKFQKISSIFLRRNIDTHQSGAYASVICESQSMSF